ncbi:MAG: replication initiation factor [Nevskiaceae bacterium]|nr:MAG: replication initiation factor [Nevskiaceae bacterium]
MTDSEDQGNTPKRKRGARTEEHTARSAAGSLPTNRDPVNCKILRYGIDSLYLSFPGDISQEGYIRLEAARRAARADLEIEKAEAQISIHDHLFAASAGAGKLFKYQLEDHAFRIQLKGPKSKRLPLAYCKISSTFLVSVGVEQAVAQLRMILSSFGSLSGNPNVSRIDLFADFTANTPLNAWEDEAWVTRAEYLNSHRVRGRFSGWSIGRGIIAARLYDKTLELKKSRKDYLLDLWKQQGWDGAHPVCRIEFQFRSEVLHQLKSPTYPGILDRLGILWHYCTYDWLRLTIPNPEDQTRSRWPTHPLWEAFQVIPWKTGPEPENVQVKLSRVPPDKVLCRSFFTALTAYMAAKGETDPERAAERLWLETRAHYEALDQFREEGFYGQARSRAAIKAIGYGVPYPGATDVAKAAQDRAVAAAYRAKSGR